MNNRLLVKVPTDRREYSGTRFAIPLRLPSDNEEPVAVNTKSTFSVKPAYRGSAIVVALVARLCSDALQAGAKFLQGGGGAGPSRFYERIAIGQSDRVCHLSGKGPLYSPRPVRSADAVMKRDFFLRVIEFKRVGQFAVGLALGKK